MFKHYFLPWYYLGTQTGKKWLKIELFSKVFMNIYEEVKDKIKSGMVIQFSTEHEVNRLAVVTDLTKNGLYFNGGFRGWKTIDALYILTATKVI
ncbi:MAG: hypothetical protein WC560_12820 [Syntrophales bacterium]